MAWSADADQPPVGCVGASNHRGGSASPHSTREPWGERGSGSTTAPGGGQAGDIGQVGVQS